MRFLLLSIMVFYVFGIVATQNQNQDISNNVVLPFPVKSIRGFEFFNYFDKIDHPDLKIKINETSRMGNLAFKGASGINWSFCLERNDQLFSSDYTFSSHEDASPRPQTLKNCHYHGKVAGFENSFVVISTCDGLHGMAVLNEYAKFSFHTLEKNRDVIMVVENQFQFSLPIDLQSVIKNVNYKSLLDLRILNEVGSHDCFVWDNAKLPFSIRYYDLTLALSHMDFGLKPEYAEQYIADIGNMLQMYFKYADLNSINFRLFATAYLSPGNKLSMVNFNYAKNYLEAGKNEVIVDDENLKFAEKFTDVWASEYPRFSFSVPNKPHPKVLLKPIVYSSVYGYAKAKLLELKSIDFPLNNFSTGVIFIQKHQVLDIYEHVLTMGHELGHLFGISHDHVYADCGNDLSAMTVGKVLGWAKFTPCNRKNIQWDKEFEHTTKNELSNFNFEALKQN